MSLFDTHGQASALTGRNLTIVAGVVLGHAAGLWALQAGMARVTLPQVVVPVAVISEIITPQPPAPPPPVPAPPPPVPPPPKPAAPKPTPPKPAVQRPQPAPMPLAVADAAPAANAPLGSVEPQPPAPPAPATAAPAPPAPAAPPAPPALVQPSSSASHLNNPAPSYPAVSRRLGEQGVVLLNVLIGTDGLPQKVDIKKSSGFERLDRQAVETVQRWRFMPGTRNGVPEAMWFVQPINFVLKQ
ncbi:hypothetical protein MASR1M59_26570 [Melaminivora sp.]